MLDGDTLSFKAKVAVEEAIGNASEYGHSDITSLHVLQALLNQDGSALTAILDHAGGDPAKLHASLERAMDHLPRRAARAGAVGVSQEFDALIRRGRDRFGDDRLGPEHLVLAMVEAPADQAGAILREEGLSAFVVTCFLLKWRQSQPGQFT